MAVVVKATVLFLSAGFECILCAAGNQGGGLLSTVENLVGVGGQQGGVGGVAGKRSSLCESCFIAPARAAFSFARINF